MRLNLLALSIFTMNRGDKDPVEGILILAGILSLVMFAYIVYLALCGELALP